uniref:Putative GTP-binding protein 6 n=1 Tax=Neovison vison TaxID=452646 RepID=A0A8C7BCE4_NEOVI
MIARCLGAPGGFVGGRTCLQLVATLGGPVVAFPWPHPPLLAICGWNSISVSWNTWVRGCFLTSVHAAGSHPRQETWARAGQAGLDGARDRAHGDVSLTLALCLLKAEWQVAEAEALVHTLDGWSVVERMVVPTKTPDGKLIFGKGTLEHLTEKVRGSPEVTAVFLNVERLATPTKKELEGSWGVPVFDRFTVVLHIFRCNARTKEARLQVALAELPLLRSRLKSSTARPDAQGRGSRYIMGSGESFVQVQQRLLKEKEMKIRKALERLRQKRQLLGRQRRRQEFPVIAVVGYTNCGKTTLIKALTGDDAVQPRDRLFATLDVTAHAGWLPSRMAVIYMDTIGFLSQLPHSLIESFSATLEDVAHSDLIIHVRDVTHPETELQKASVLSSLHGLRLPTPLLDSMLEVHNKTDLVPGYSPAEPQAVAVSALRGLGLPELKARLEDAVLRATGRQVLTLRVRLAGAQLSWLHQEATVQAVDVIPEAGVADVTVVISKSAYGKFRKLFPA